MKKNIKKIIVTVVALAAVLGGIGTYNAFAKESNVRELEVELEADTMVYEVEFVSEGFEYEYDVDAKSGEILHSQKEQDDDYVASVEEKPVEKKVSSTADIGKEKAKSIALKHAGFSESQVSRLEVERDVDDGEIEYSVEFEINEKEYDYEINGIDGKILEVDVETEDRD